MNVDIALIRAAIRLTTPLTLVALGGIICLRAGVLNLALEGKMLLGSFLAVVVSYYVGASWLGVGAAMGASLALSALFGFFFLRYKVNPVILALALNLLVAEMTIFFLQVLFGVSGAFSDPRIRALPLLQIPVISRIPFLGDILSGYNAIVYFSWFAVAGCYFLLFRTRFGRHMRATGENLEAAETAGIRVNRVRYLSLLISGILVGAGGAYLSVGHLTLFTSGMTAGRGFTGLVAAIFGGTHPVGAFFATLFFGAADAVTMRLQQTARIPSSILLIFPHAVTVIAISLVGMRKLLHLRLARRQFRLRIDAMEKRQDQNTGEIKNTRIHE